MIEISCEDFQKAIGAAYVAGQEGRIIEHIEYIPPFSVGVSGIVIVETRRPISPSIDGGDK